MSPKHGSVHIALSGTEEIQKVGDQTYFSTGDLSSADESVKSMPFSSPESSRHVVKQEQKANSKSKHSANRRDQVYAHNFYQFFFLRTKKNFYLITEFCK